MRISDWSSDVCSSDLNSPSFFIHLITHFFINSPCFFISVFINSPSILPVSSSTLSLTSSSILPVSSSTLSLTSSSILPVSSSTLRSEEHTSELKSLMRISYAVFCLNKKKHLLYNTTHQNNIII